MSAVVFAALAAGVGLGLMLVAAGLTGRPVLASAGDVGAVRVLKGVGLARLAGHQREMGRDHPPARGAHGIRHRFHPRRKRRDGGRRRAATGLRAFGVQKIVLQIDND